MQYRSKIMRKDIGYLATFDDKEAAIVQTEMDRINAGYSFRGLTDVLDRCWNDHRNLAFEPIKLTKQGNKLVNEGLIALAEMQVGKRTRRFDYYVIGEGTTPVNIRDDTLDDEHSRVRIPDAGGTFVQKQSTIFYSVFFNKGIPDGTISESAIVDAKDTVADRMLLRTVIPNAADYIPHFKTFDTVFMAHLVFSGSV